MRDPSSEIGCWLLNGLRADSHTLESFARQLKGKSVCIVGAGSSLGRSLGYFFFALSAEYSLSLTVSLVARQTTLNQLKESGLLAIYQLYENDVRNEYDYIFFCASPASPVQYLSDPLRTIESNTVLLLNWIKKIHPQTTLFYFSTSGVYGDYDRTESIPDENSPPGNSNHLDVRQVYIQAKKMGETICRAYESSAQGRALIIRPSITFTPFCSQWDNRLHTEVLRCLFNNQTLNLRSNGEDKRNFLFVVDFISAIMRIVLSDAGSQIYNITHPREVSVLEYLNEIRDVSFPGASLDIEHVSETEPSGTEFTSTTVVNHNLNALGWRPFWSLREAYSYIGLLYERVGVGPLVY